MSRKCPRAYRAPWNHQAGDATCVSPEADLSRYRLVVVPLSSGWWIKAWPTACARVLWPRAATWLLTFHSGLCDLGRSSSPGRVPGPAAGLAGVLGGGI